MRPRVPLFLCPAQPCTVASVAATIVQLSPRILVSKAVAERLPGNSAQLLNSWPIWILAAPLTTILGNQRPLGAQQRRATLQLPTGGQATARIAATDLQ